MSQLTFTTADFAEASVLARHVEAEMLSRLDVVAIQPKRLLIQGHGIHSAKQLLQKRYLEAEVIGLDLAEQMLKSSWACLTMDELPFAEKSMDLIISNLFLPWCTDQEKLFAEWKRILHPEGLLMFTCYGPDTLCELQNTGTLVPHLVDMHNVGDALMQAGFSDPVLDVEQFTLNYKDSEKFLHELRVTGMIHKADDVPFSNTITYEVIYAHTWGKAESQDMDDGIVKIPLTALGGRTKNFL